MLWEGVSVDPIAMGKQYRSHVGDRLIQEGNQRHPEEPELKRYERDVLPFGVVNPAVLFSLHRM